MNGWTNACQFNSAKCMELALTEGVCPMTDSRWALRRLRFPEMKSIDVVIDAYKKQIEYFVYHMTTAISTYIKYQAQCVLRCLHLHSWTAA